MVEEIRYIYNSDNGLDWSLLLLRMVKKVPQRIMLQAWQGSITLFRGRKGISLRPIIFLTDYLPHMFGKNMNK